MLFLAGEWLGAFLDFGTIWLVVLFALSLLGWFAARFSAKNRS